MITSRQVKSTLVALTLTAAGTLAVPAGAAPTGSGALTLQSIANGCLQVPNLACGQLAVHLKDGYGSSDGVEVVLGKVVFGTLGASGKSAAVAQIAYKDDTFGWNQELVFLTTESGKIVQAADFPIDDREQLQRFEIAAGTVLVDTTQLQSTPAQHKITKISIVPSKEATDKTEPPFTIKESCYIAAAFAPEKGPARNVKLNKTSK